MLRPCTENEFYEYADFAYALATDPTRSGYPSYCDGIKTKADFVERSLKAFAREDEELLLFEAGGEVQGLIQYFWLPEDRYLETVSFCVNQAAEQALSEFLARLAARFPGFDLFLGFPAENTAAVSFLTAQGFSCIEDDWNNTAFLDRLDSVPEIGGTVRIGRESFESFRTLHSRIEGEMFWNSERILADLDNWVILLKEHDGVPQGAVYSKKLNDEWYEIFGIDTERHDPELFRSLLNAALSDAKQSNVRYMTFFCEKEDEQIALECGFQCIGNYLCFQKRLG